MTIRYCSSDLVTEVLVIAVVIYSPMYNAMYLQHLPDPTSDRFFWNVEFWTPQPFVKKCIGPPRICPVIMLCTSKLILSEKEIYSEIYF